MKIIGILDKFNRAVVKGIEIIVAVAIMAITVILFLNVFTRFVLNSGISWAEELCAMLVVAVAFTGLSYAATVGTHVVMTVVYDLCPERFQKVLSILGYLVTAITCFWCFAITAKYVGTLYTYGRFSPALRIPYWIPYMFMPIGFFWTGVQNAILFIVNLVDRKTIHEKLMDASEVVVGDADSVGNVDEQM